MSMKAKELAEYVVETYPSEDISPLKLQKLLYYVKAWGLVAGIPLVQGGFLKWDFGPVNKAVYVKYKKYKGDPIPTPKWSLFYNRPTGRRKQLIDFILESYMPFSAVSLSSLTHDEAPWEDTPHNEIISEDLMKEYYSQQPFAKNFQPEFSPNDRYYPVQSDLWSSFVLDMDEQDREWNAHFPSFNAFLSELKSAQEHANNGVREWLDAN